MNTITIQINNNTYSIAFAKCDAKPMLVGIAVGILVFAALSD